MQRDLVLRWIEQLGQLIARLLRGNRQADLSAAREQVDEASAALLGPLSALVPQLEVESAADLLADPHRIFGYAQLMDLDGVIVGAMGNAAGAEELRARALRFAGEAVKRLREPEPGWEQWIAERADPGRATGS